MLGNGKLGQIVQTHKGIFAHITHVFGDIDCLQSGLIEDVGHDHHFSAAAESYGLQILDLTESVMVDDCHAVGDGHGRDVGISEGFLGNFRHREALCKGQ